MAAVRAGVGFTEADAVERAIRAQQGLDVTVVLHRWLTYAWLVFAVLALVAALPLVLNGSGRTFAAAVCYGLGLPLLLFGIGVPAVVPGLGTPTWLACGAILLSACFLVLTAGTVPRPAPGRARPARSSRR